MGPAPRQFDDLEIVRFTPIDARHHPTGGCRHVIAGVLHGPFAELVICRNETGTGYFLFYCDEEWKLETDGWHMTLEEAMSQAEFEYEGVAATWQRPT